VAKGGGRVRDIRRLGDPVLREACEPVTRFDAALIELVADLFATMNAAKGVGLAANQIGVAQQVFVYSCPDDSGRRRIGHVVNPVLATDESAGTRRGVPEGCLSIPGVHAELSRPATATVSGTDAGGKPVTVVGTGLLARCLAHEVDHLAGTLFADRLGRLARARLLRAYHRI
jgi:peptide deformylase